MAGATNDTAFSVFANPYNYEVDPSLPRWARRSNPLVRRHLGPYWRKIDISLDRIPLILGVQFGVLLFSLVMRIALFFALFPVFTLMPLVLIPAAAGLYAWALFSIGRDTAVTIADDQASGRLTLLRTTPYSLQHILYSFIAASIWRQAERLNRVVMIVVYLALPLWIVYYAALLPPERHPLVSHGVIIAGMLVTLLRILPEAGMSGALGLYLGLNVHPRAMAVFTLLGLLVSYAIFLNVPRLLYVLGDRAALPWPVFLLVEFALPLLAPLVISWAALALIARDLQNS